MVNNKQAAIFEGQKIRRIWDDKKRKMVFFAGGYHSNVNSTRADYQTARKYWNKLKERLKKEGNESVSNCHQLKFEASDGKFYLTDAADVETILRLVQSVPSPKAEPIKLLLAKVGYERISDATGYTPAKWNQRGGLLPISLNLTDAGCAATRTIAGSLRQWELQYK